MVGVLAFGGSVYAADLTVVGAVTNSREYDGSVTATVNFVGATLGGDTSDCPTATLNSLGYSASFETKNVGSGKTVAVIGLTLNDPGTCTLAQPVLNDGEITQRAITVTAQPNTKAYDGLTSSASTPVITVGILAAGDDDSFTQSYNNPNVDTGKTLTATGTISDSGLVDVTSNYNITFIPDATGEIIQASLIITAANKSKNYGDANPTLTANYSGFVNGETEAVLDIPVSLSTLADTTSGVGPYTITASGAADANYLITHQIGTLTVNTRPITVTADAKSKTYGALDPTLTSQITSGSLVNGDLLTGSLTRVAGADAGTYAIEQGSLVATVNYNLVFVGANLVINKAPLSVTANDDSKTYNGVAYSGGNGVVYSSFVNFENESVLGGALVFGGNSQGATNAGTYIITPSGLTSGNYEITFNSGALTVNKANATIDVPDVTFTYDGDSHGVTGTATGAAGEDLFGLFDFGSTFRNFPGGTADWTFDGDTNHNSSNGLATVTIDKRAITIRGASDTKVYDGTVTSSAIPNITVGSLASGDTHNFSQTYATKDVAGPSKTTRPSPSSSVNDSNSGNNYEITRLDGANGTITAAPLTATVSVDDKEYDGTNVATISTRNLNGVVVGETITANGGIAMFVDANADTNKDVSISGMTLGGTGTGNYSFDGLASAQADITAKPITVTANSFVKAFGTPDPTFFTHNGVLLGTDTFTGALERLNTDESVGVYAITQGTLSAGENYDMNFNPGTLTISDEEAPVITLLGDSTQYVWSAYSYVETGASATDNVDGDISANIVISSSVVNGQPGTYTVTYNVTDSNGNVSVEVTRTVIIQASSNGKGSRGRSSGAASTQALQAVNAAGVTLPAPAAGVILGATIVDEPARQAAIAAIKSQIASLIQELLGLLRAQLAAAIAAGN